MAASEHEIAQQEIETRLHEINRAWREGRLDELANHFHREIVMVRPDFGGQTTGLPACVKSFEDFLAAAKVRDSRESEIAVRVWGSTAVGTFRFDITYVMDGRELTEAGREIWVFVRRQEGWRAVWRTQLPIG
jgi:ketosteroid isomerase-like protein